MTNPNSLYYHYGSNRYRNSPVVHKYDAPGLTAIEFLNVVKNDDTLSMSLRRKAALHLVSLENPFLDTEDPLSAAPDMSPLYAEFVEVVQTYHEIFGGEIKPIEFYLRLISLMSSWNAQRPDDLAHDIKYYSKFLHSPEGHA